MSTTAHQRLLLASPFAALLLALFLTSTPRLAAQDDASSLAGLLPKIRSYVDKFVQEFSYLRYDEDVVQEKLKTNEKVLYKQETLFDSIIRMQYEENRLSVDEQRIPEKSPRKVETRPLLSTYGFSTLAMVFHPYYEQSFRFTRLEDDTLDGRLLARVRFQHIPGQSSPVLYQMIGADKPLELSGVAWVDPATGEIHRIEAALNLESNDLGIKAIRAEVSYAPVALKDDPAPALLPATAKIDLETPRQHWRNIHHFADYRKYRVTMSISGAFNNDH